MSLARGRTGFDPVRSVSQHCSNASNDNLSVAARLETDAPESYLCLERIQLRELGVQMIPAYSPQAGGGSERNFATWKNRLPQELGLAGIKSLECQCFSARALRGRVQPPFSEAGGASGQRLRAPSQP